MENGKLAKAALYSVIESLCRRNGYCWASNEYLANKIGRKNPGNISQYIQELKRDGWIKIEINMHKRKIWLVRDYCGKTIDPIRNNRSLPSEISEDSSIKSNIKSSRELNEFNNKRKGLIDKFKCSRN